MHNSDKQLVIDTSLINNNNPIDISFISTYSNKHGGVVSESLGPEALAGDLLGEFNAEVNVNHFDLQLDDVNKIRSKISELGSSVIGISVKIGATDQLKRIMEEIDTLQNNPVIMLGGVVPTFASDEILKRYPNALVAIGEAETTMRGIVHYLRGRQGIEKIPGIARIVEGSKVSTKVERIGLEQLHLPARITTERVYKELGGLVWFEGSRGCDWHCTFCSRRALRGDGFSGDISPSHVVDDLENLYKMGINSVHATDDDWGGDPERTLAIAEDLIERNIDIKWSMSTRADHVWKEPDASDNQNIIMHENERLRYILKRQIDAGLDRVFLGLESFSPSQLKRYGKQISVESNFKAVKILRELGVDVVAGYIPLDPLMSIEELQENLVGLRSSGMHKKVTNPLSVLRIQDGSPYLRMARSREKIDGIKYVGERTEDLVFYDIENYKDSRVQIVADLADKWVSEMYPLIFGLKMDVFATTQDSRLNNDQNSWSENTLYSFRELEMSFIENVTQYLINGGKNDRGLKDITDGYKQTRKNMIARTHEDMNSMNISFKNLDIKEMLSYEE